MAIKIKKIFGNYRQEGKKIKKLPLNKLSWIFNLILIAGLLAFLYTSFYQPLNDIQILITLKKQVSPEKLNMEAWNKINQQIKIKKQVVNFSQMQRNPFE